MSNQIIVQINPDVPPTGSDLGITNAARKSFGRRSEWEVDFDCPEFTGRNVLKEKDKRLLEFLARGMTTDDFNTLIGEFACLGDVDNCYEPEDYEELKQLLWQWRNTPTHASPFGHAFMSFEIKIPLFLARQLVKHKFLRWSEYSRRYITDDVEFYQHEYRSKAEDVKQGSSGTHKNSATWQEQVSTHNGYQLDLYNKMIDDGVAPEQARGVLPTDLMTSLTWSGSLDAFADMCKLRLCNDSQKEAQFVAREVYTQMEKYFPVSARCLVYGC